MADQGPTTDNLNGGWIRAYRSLFDPRRDPFLEHGMRTGDFRQWAAWLYCLSLVNYQPEPSKLFVRGRLVVVGQGQFFVTQEMLARMMGWKSRQPARDFLSKLEQLGRIGPQKEPFQVLNWQDYNEYMEPQNQPQGNHRGTTGEPPSKHEELKHEEKTNTDSCSEPPEAAASEPPCGVPYEQIRTEWNTMATACGLALAERVGADRKKVIRARWADKHWREEYKQALALIPSRPFALGRNDRGWRMDFDFFIKPGKVTKILEGAYQGGGKGNDATPFSPPPA